MLLFLLWHSSLMYVQKWPKARNHKPRPLTLEGSFLKLFKHHFCLLPPFLPTKMHRVYLWGRKNLCISIFVELKHLQWKFMEGIFNPACFTCMFSSLQSLWYHQLFISGIVRYHCHSEKNSSTVLLEGKEDKLSLPYNKRPRSVKILYYCYEKIIVMLKRNLAVGW